MRIPSEARPHEVAILLLFRQGMNAKQIAYVLHYRHSQPVQRVIAKWKTHFEPMGSTSLKPEVIAVHTLATRSFTASLNV